MISAWELKYKIEGMKNEGSSLINFIIDLLIILKK